LIAEGRFDVFFTWALLFFEVGSPMTVEPLKYFHVGRSRLERPLELSKVEGGTTRLRTPHRFIRLALLLELGVSLSKLRRLNSLGVSGEGHGFLFANDREGIDLSHWVHLLG